MHPLIKVKSVKGVIFDDDPARKDWVLIEFLDGSTLCFSDYFPGPLMQYVPGPKKKS